MENVIIIGSGPAGHTAAIYAARANLRPLMFEGFMAGGVAAGGQLTTTTDVENYPGFPDGVSGPELMNRMRTQSTACGTRIITETVEKTSLSGKEKLIFTGTGNEQKEYKAKTVIIATGAIAKRLNLPGETVLWQKGISACAVCDGALPIFRDQPLVVIGGGDTACEEANYLAKFGSTVHLLVRRDVLRASKAIQKRVLSNDKIMLHWNTTATEATAGEANAFGQVFLNGVNIKNNKSGEASRIDARGLFYAIGHLPNTVFLDGQLELDDSGYVITTPHSTATSVTGIFACGDVKDKVYRQAVTAAGSGCMAALDAEHYLADAE